MPVLINFYDAGTEAQIKVCISSKYSFVPHNSIVHQCSVSCICIYLFSLPF
jgi:hypothetical protein